MIKNIKLGADPELFLTKDGEYISAEGLIGGSKNEPKVISDEGHAIQEDNVMVEFNIPPSSTKQEFKDNINFVKLHLKTLAEVKGMNIAIDASAELDPKYLQTEQAQMFGCEPDFNYYLKDFNPAPCAANKTLRSCGGHIHVGYDNPSQATTVRIVFAMDVMLGLPSVLIDKDDRRKELYGRAGSFRFKEYGLEYRSLSNFWIRSDKSIEWAYDNTMKAIDLAQSELLQRIEDEYGEQVQYAIDNNDKELAIAIYSKIEELINEKVTV